LVPRRLLLRFVVTYGATRGCPKYGVMPGYMPRHTADRGSAETARSVGRMDGEGQEYGRAESNCHFNHLDFSPGPIASPHVTRRSTF
jgi:hypothetical protein